MPVFLSPLFLPFGHLYLAIYLGAYLNGIESQRRFFISGVCHSPRVVILFVSGLREWDLIRVGRFCPRIFTAEPVRRLIGESAESVHAPPYIRVGREDGFSGRAAGCMSGFAF